MTWVLQSFIPRESMTVSLRYWKWHRTTVFQVGKHRKRKVSNEADCLWVGALWGYCHCCVPSGSPKVPVGLSLEKTSTAQPPVLPFGPLRAPEVSNAARLVPGAGVKVHNSLPLPFKIFLSGENNHFSQSVKSWRLMAGRWQYHMLEVQLPASLTLQATHHLPVAESLKAYAILFREWREKSTVGVICSDGKGSFTCMS